MKRVMLIVMILAMIIVLWGCSLGIDMPFNGVVSFHDITITIPSDFIRDSTRSNQDQWCFEKDRYSQMIILQRKDAGSDVSATLDDYVVYMTEQGCSSQRTTFRDLDAVRTTYTKDGQFCQEVLFCLNESLYAIALRGGTEDSFAALLDSVVLPSA